MKRIKFSESTSREVYYDEVTKRIIFKTPNYIIGGMHTCFSLSLTEFLVIEKEVKSLERGSDERS